MSRFMSHRHSGMKPYVPGEQPQDQKYIKLNTNESPFPPSTKAMVKANEALNKLQLYPDPECRELAEKIALHFGIDRSNVILSNGSDEVLNFAYIAYCDSKNPAIFPDITYGFYPVFAETNNVPYKEIPLKEDFTIDINEYKNAGGTIIIANPNAHTGIALPVEQIEEVVKANPDNVVVVDEAYVDFGADSCISLTQKYENVIVIQTLSKSRSMAGARLGFAVANKDLIQDLNTIRNSTNPYNINAMTMAAGIGMMEDNDYTEKNCQTIIENREYTVKALKEMGFELTDSIANFIFMKHPTVDGEHIYKEMKKKGVLIRHFDKERIAQYNRVTIGSKGQMDTFLKVLQEVLEEA